MKLRLKTTLEEVAFCGLNRFAISEVLTGDDSVFMRDLDVYLENTNPPGWKDLSQAFRDRDVIANNNNTTFRESLTEDERNRGYYY